MDDEEDDMSRPVSQLWGTPFRDVKFQERAIQITGGGDFPLQEHATDVPSCSFRWQPQEDRGRQNEALAERPEEQPEVSVEVQIGRKLREIGDQFNQDHMEFMRHRRQNVPLWMRLTAALFGLLFPRGAPPPRLRGALR
uniref:Bcl2 modifying factor 2 n=1 Tax=Oryzias melastigma TaxID=30732 RepID=A0A3B3DRZ6_ORYME